MEGIKGKSRRDRKILIVNDLQEIKRLEKIRDGYQAQANEYNIEINRLKNRVRYLERKLKDDTNGKI